MVLEYRLVRTIAGKGTQPGQFAERLSGLAIDKADRVFAAGDSCVKVFDAEGTLLKQWNTARPGTCIAVDGDGRVFVGQAEQIEIFEPQGKLTATWNDAARLGRVTAIDFAGSDVVVADARERCLRRFTRDGQFINDIRPRPGNRPFLIPNGTLDFAIDGAGVIHAAHPGKHRVERYSLDGEMLGFMGRFDGIDPEGFSGCCNPTNVTVTADGTLFVTEKAAPRAKAYTRDGKLLAIVSDDAFDLGCKNMDLVVDSAGRVFIIDTTRLHICVFEPTPAGLDQGTAPSPPKGGLP